HYKKVLYIFCKSPFLIFIDLMRHGHHVKEQDPHTVKEMKKYTVCQDCGCPQKKDPCKIPYCPFLKPDPCLLKEHNGKPERNCRDHWKCNPGHIFVQAESKYNCIDQAH